MIRSKLLVASMGGAGMKQAKATNVKLVADAKAHKTSIDARTEAREDTREAQQK